MLTFSPYKPATPTRSTQFGALWETWRRPEPLLRFDLNKLNGWTGFTPNKTIQELFGINKTSAVIVINNQIELDKYWQKLNLPNAEKPAVRFGEEAVLLVADERADSTTSQPLGIEFNRRYNEMRVTILRDDNRRNMGVGWYVAKVYNGYLPIDIRRRFSVMDWFILSPRTEINITKIAPRRPN